MIDLAASVQYAKGVGPRRAEGLARLGVERVEDLLLHLPMRYEDRRLRVTIAQLRPGVRTSVQGSIVVAGLRRARRFRLFEIRLADDSGRLKALWFNQPYLKDVLTRGRRVSLYGLVERDPYGGQLQMSSPQFELLAAGAEELHTAGIVPIYEKLGPLTGKALRGVLARLCAAIPDDLPDPLPDELRRRLRVERLGPALRAVHVPPADAALEMLNAARGVGHRRLILEEFFLFQLGLLRRRQAADTGSGEGNAFEIGERTREAVKRILPFHLTEAQKRVLREIADDMRAPRAMGRLLQGDVGSGKTVVALLAMVIAVEGGRQAAFMVPTEILAEQHFLTLRRLLHRCDYGVELLTAALKGRRRRELLERLASGQTQIVVGTHALIEDDVAFGALGLVVIDEQHRFGVMQREGLVRKGHGVDLLVMTATPIPRTLALTAYGDLDVSLLDERPPGRRPVRTAWLPAAQRPKLISRVRAEVAAGRQAYVVYPLVAESENLEDVKAATAMAEEWRGWLPGLRVGLLHGRLTSAEKEAVMGAFAGGAIQVLVATTVVEVGVDVPNASLMVIEHAERFGLAQLHQLRGRVGRGEALSTCILLSHGHLSDEARARLQTMVETDDGFAIAERDLEIRGPGDFFGTRQSGMPRFRVGDLMRDRDLLEEARREAHRWAGEHPTHDPLAAATGAAWQRFFRVRAS